MTDLRKAAEMALEFVVLSSSKDRAWFTEKEFEVVAALRKALVQPEQEPVAWGFRRIIDGVILDIKNSDEHEGYEETYTVPLYTAPPSLEAAVSAEREACAKVCDLVAKEIDDTNGIATYCAAAIRARGEK